MMKFDWLIGQIGLRRSEKARSRAMLLELDELPGANWVTLYEGTWRVGTNQPRTPELRNAKAAGGATAVRSFEEQTAIRWLWVRVDPLASRLDASSLSEDIRDYIVPDPRAPRPLTQDRTIEDVRIPGYANARVFELKRNDAQGSGTAWVFAGHIDRIALTAQYSFYNDSWSWSEALSIISLQVEKIQRRMRTGTQDGATAH
jgi:hypothetical protein